MSIIEPYFGAAIHKLCISMNALTITKELSSRLVDGKKQILVRVSISRTNRPRFKTGVMVSPAYFKDGEIIKNKRGRKDPIEVLMLTEN